MTKIYFITGTDTNIGKTTATIGLLQDADNINKNAIGLKPIATGCFYQNNILVNDDALLLQKFSNMKIEYQDINPFRFEHPVSPHLVNKNDIKSIDIATHCKTIINKYKPDICYIEGAGGWLCPLNNTETFARIAELLDVPIILVVGIKLGCLNHALLTYHNIKNSSLHLNGWIANLIDPEAHFFAQENIDFLKARINAPLIKTISYQN